jgi:hypothetical protein
MDYGSSTLYFTDRNSGYSSTSLYQGSNYVGIDGISPTRFNWSSDFLNPPSLYFQTEEVSNYAKLPSMMFVGDFDGFWIHRIYRDGNLVMIIQGVDQQLFVPVAYDWVQSVCLSISPDAYSGGSLTVDPIVPPPGMSILMGVCVVAVLLWSCRSRRAGRGPIGPRWEYPD